MFNNNYIPPTAHNAPSNRHTHTVAQRRSDGHQMVLDGHWRHVVAARRDEQLLPLRLALRLALRRLAKKSVMWQLLSDCDKCARSDFLLRLPDANSTTS